MPNLLAQFRNVPQTAQAAKAADREDDAEALEYQALITKDDNARLLIVSAVNADNCPLYGHLIDVSTDHQAGNAIMLVYTHMLVYIEGRNLRPVANAIRSSTAKIIYTFDPQRWPRPADASAPIIESMDIVTHDLTAARAKIEKKLKPQPV